MKWLNECKYFNKDILYLFTDRRWRMYMLCRDPVASVNRHRCSGAHVLVMSDGLTLPSRDLHLHLHFDGI